MAQRRSELLATDKMQRSDCDTGCAVLARAAMVPTVPWTPEKDLLVALLDRAWHDLRRVRYSSEDRDPYIREKAVAWLWARYPCHPGFAFLEVCDALGVEPNATRKFLLAATTGDVRTKLGVLHVANAHSPVARGGASRHAVGE